MANVDGVAQIQMLEDRRRVRGVVVHVVAVTHLTRPAMAAPVMSDDSISLPEQVEHLGVPVVGAQWPTMMEDDGLRVLWTPVLVENFHSVLGGNRAHLTLLHPRLKSRRERAGSIYAMVTSLLPTGCCARW